MRVVVGLYLLVGNWFGGYGRLVLAMEAWKTEAGLREQFGFEEFGVRDFDIEIPS